MATFAVVIAAAASCSKSAGNQEKPAPAPTAGGAGEKIAVPGAQGGAPVPTQAAQPASGGAVAACTDNDDPKRHISPEEGTLQVGKAEAKAGTEGTATVTVTPAPNFHISQEYPMSLALEAPPGVKLAKAELAKADAVAFSEKTLQLAIKETSDKAGTYEIKGCFKFGVCDPSSCHPKKQPISIQVAAN
ncbi:MAG: hypothetical protein ACM31C_32115 [Acidobacteriota bacterium]